MESNEVVKVKNNTILIVVSVLLIVVALVVGWYVGSNNVDCSLEKEEVKTEEKAVNYGKWMSEFTQIDSLYGGQNYCSADSDYYLGVALKNGELYKITSENIESLGIKNVQYYSIEHISNACDIFHILYLTNDGKVYSLDIELNESKLVVDDVDYYSCESVFSSNGERITCTYTKRSDYSFAKFELDVI